jgi:transcriptional regulator with XRE-family HTH domain
MVLSKSLPLGEKLRMTRETKGLTLDMLSEAAGVNIGTISRIERGATKDPGIQSSNKLANALEISPSFLTSTEDDEVEFQVALRLQSLRRFLVIHPLSDEQERSLKQLCFFDSAPNSVRGWQDLMHNANYLFEHGILR